MDRPQQKFLVSATPVDLAYASPESVFEPQLVRAHVLALGMSEWLLAHGVLLLAVSLRPMIGFLELCQDILSQKEELPGHWIAGVTRVQSLSVCSLLGPHLSQNQDPVLTLGMLSLLQHRCLLIKPPDCVCT